MSVTPFVANHAASHPAEGTETNDPEFVKYLQVLGVIEE